MTEEETRALAYQVAAKTGEAYQRALAASLAGDAAAAAAVQAAWAPVTDPPGKILK